MQKIFKALCLATFILSFFNPVYAAVCAVGEPPCSNCQADPLEPSGCSVSNCCDGNGVSHSCTCNEKNAQGECTQCAF
ncbi:hypothetical protein [Legionella sp. km772]|uniref:hypothetical protein n=1 Tax=Legionella sp. km772 TaxID=2498111 RepID=UPI000F8D78C0|nr:hypothetical protein [Legionella sp. km772]RUR11003.1 hypothetical protein ELY15_07555 [Legionella sp. km772]